MNQVSQIAEAKDKPIALALSDIKCILNPVQASDLASILSMVLSSRRLDVAMAFAGVPSLMELSTRIGICNVSVGRWVYREAGMPLAGAYRIAKVFGVPVDLLLEHYTTLQSEYVFIKDSEPPLKTSYRRRLAPTAAARSRRQKMQREQGDA